MIPLEFDEQWRVVAYLDLLSGSNKIKYSAIPNSTYTKSWKQKAKNKMSGLRPGLPDLFIIINTKPLFIEMKRIKRGVLSPQQKEWINCIKEAGIDCYVCKGFHESKAVIDQYLI